MPSIMNSPWAKLIISMRPQMIVKPDGDERVEEPHLEAVGDRLKEQRHRRGLPGDGYFAFGRLSRSCQLGVG